MTSPQSGTALMNRLWQRTERPGCVRLSHVQAILARHTRIGAGLAWASGRGARPSLAELLLRRGHGAEYAAQDAPVIVAARPADVWPEMAAQPDAAAMAAPSPAAVAAPAPRPTVQARLSRPSDIASVPPVPVRPGPNAETSSPAAVLRDTPRVEVVGAAAGEATATSRSAPPFRPPATVTTALITTAEGAPTMSRAPARSAGDVPSVIIGQSGRYLPDTTHDHGKGIAEGSQVPIVRESHFYHNGIGRSASSIAQRPARLPASIAITHLDRPAPVAPVTGMRDLHKAIAALMAPGLPSTGRADPPVRQRDPAGRDTDPPGPPGHRADAAGHRADPPSRRADPPGRYDDPASREQDRSRQVDIERIVGTVQRRLAHHMTIERERRGMMR